MKEAILSILGKVSQTGKDIGVALLDTGICPMEDFVEPQNRIFVFQDFVNGKQTPYDDNGHGTHVEGCKSENTSLKIPMDPNFLPVVLFFFTDFNRRNKVMRQRKCQYGKRRNCFCIFSKKKAAVRLL